jgi:hypothetical protein
MDDFQILEDPNIPPASPSQATIAIEEKEKK